LLLSLEGALEEQAPQSRSPSTEVSKISMKRIFGEKKKATPAPSLTETSDSIQKRGDE
jgi:hypothetical protein